MKSCAAVARSLGMLDLVTAGRGEMGEMCQKTDLSLVRKTEGLCREVARDGLRYSPGK